VQLSQKGEVVFFPRPNELSPSWKATILRIAYHIIQRFKDNVASFAGYFGF